VKAEAEAAQDARDALPALDEVRLALTLRLSTAKVSSQ